MRATDVKVGETYETKINKRRCRVVVVRSVVRTGWQSTNHTYPAQTVFEVCREGTTIPLPKLRSASALHSIEQKEG